MLLYSEVDLQFEYLELTEEMCGRINQGHEIAPFVQR